MVDHTPPSLRWRPFLGQLEAALQVTQETQHTLLNTVGASDGDVLPAAFGRLAKALADLQTAMPPGVAGADAPSEVKLGLEQLGAGLHALSEQTARLSARDRRALDLLFPNDALKAYSRLGGRGPSLGGSAYLKA